jgi:hypothetical protein
MKITKFAIGLAVAMLIVKLVTLRWLEASYSLTIVLSFCAIYSYEQTIKSLREKIRDNDR